MLAKALLFYLVSLPKVVADSNLEIRLERYADVNLRQKDGSCCRSDCSKSCENYIEVCSRSSVSTGPCMQSFTTGLFRTEISPIGIGHVKEFTSGETLGNGLKNPLSLPLNGQPLDQGGLYLDFKVWNNYSDPAKLVVELNCSITLDNETQPFHVQLEDAVASKVLSFVLEVICTPNFFGSDCSIFCSPKDSFIEGHYNCSANGSKLCLQGWTQPQHNCTVIQPTPESKVNTNSNVVETSLERATSSVSRTDEANVGAAISRDIEELQTGDIAAICVGGVSAFIITILVVWIIMIKTNRGCCISTAARIKEAGEGERQGSSTYLSMNTSPLTDGKTHGDITEVRSWLEERPFVQSLDLNKQDETHHYWEVSTDMTGRA